jgi:mono/diheme cytochrome c family protein
MSRPEQRRAALVVLAAVAALGGACRQDMHDQPRIEPLQGNRFFADGSGARPLPAHAVARGHLRDDVALYGGTHPDGSLLTQPPMPVTRELLVRGRERYDIFCAPCHGRLGEGTGMVVRRGYKQPSSYHVDRLRQVPLGYFFFVMSNGFGVMPSYAPQIPAEDRWAIAAYIRALQLSRHFEAERLSTEQRSRLDAPAGAQPAAAAH